MSDRRAQTMQLSGNEYAKVAERLKIFREENPKGKHESAYDVDVDGTIVFTVWLWKDKTDLLDLMKAGITDKDALRSSADANGTAKSNAPMVADQNSSQANKVQKTKDFEKLESVALGRALANLGYLASGEIASSEEMEAFAEFKQHQAEEAAADLVEQIGKTTGNLDLNKLLQANSAMLKNPIVVAAAKEQQAKFALQTKQTEMNPTKAEADKKALDDTGNGTKEKTDADN